MSGIFFFEARRSKQLVFLIRCKMSCVDVVFVLLFCMSLTEIPNNLFSPFLDAFIFATTEN